jgi:hypothetical protein
LSAITARRRRPERVEVLRALAPGLRLVGVALDDLDRSGNQNFPRVAGLEERVANPERNLCLIDLDDAFEKFAVRIDH